MIDDPYWTSFLPLMMEDLSSDMLGNLTDMVEPFGITSSQAIYLIALYHKDGQTLVELSKFLNMDPANTNRMIRILKNKGYVYDDRAIPNSKKYQIYLTEDGKQLTDLIMYNVKVLNSIYFAGISDKDIIALRAILMKMRMNAVVRNPPKQKEEAMPFTDYLLNSVMEDAPLKRYSLKQRK